MFAASKFNWGVHVVFQTHWAFFQLHGLERCPNMLQCHDTQDMPTEAPWLSALELAGFKFLIYQLCTPINWRNLGDLKHIMPCDAS